ncbi:YihY/virulence factor BrkB family protein [Riemerella columbina]|uniref:YihY/virulence factor BrkB family protein n=1 Tax=Riemerella columbina TaxID=103810 RepID=UPI00267042F9|nr:YihY/virulence factor BrkB family protein [Riemerella columbina]WKS94732.1 YihY/virulence factor BrkB family protein [Riemerella columbina]
MPKKLPSFIIKIHRYLDSIHIPFLGISLWKMFEIYGQGLFKNQVIKQASSISWSFFLSLFPFILFLLSILPYMPHYDKLQFYIFEVLMPNILPAHMQSDVSGYIQDSIIPNMESLSKVTILFALVFATNGTYSLINGFNENTDSKRGFIKEYAISLAVTVVFVALILLSIFGIYYSEVVLKLFKPQYDMSWLVSNLSQIIGFISFPLFYFVLLVLFYWVGCVKIKQWKYAIPGAILTTVLFVLTTYGFVFYMTNFAKYNVLYGSIGSIILVMIWVNLNIVLILFGNELNLSIDKVRREKIIGLEEKA